MSLRRRLLMTGALVASGVAATPVHAAWPGANGRIAFDAITERGVQVRTSTLDGRRQRVVARFPPLPIGLEQKSGGPQWSPAGDRVVYQRIATGIETVAGDGHGRRTIETSLLWPGWSPGGRELVAVVAESRFHSLVRMRLDGWRQREIPIPALDNVALPRWSPTGRWILFEEGSPAGVFTWRVRPDGSGARRLVQGSRYSWSPSGRRFAYIAFVRQVPADAHDTSTVLTIPARGGRERRRFGGERFIGFIDWQPR